MIDYPSEFGTIIKDLSPNEKDRKNKTLYIIETDDNPRDFSSPCKIYGLFWSADGPGPVNQIAIGLWSKMSSPEGRDCEHNVDGIETKNGECYKSNACIGYGRTFLSISVSDITGSKEKVLCRLHKNGMLEKALDIVGIDAKGLEPALDELGTSYPWLREEGTLDPIYEIFDNPEAKMKLLQKITKWRPEKRLQIGKQYVVSMIIYPTTIETKNEFCNEMNLTFFGPDWELEVDKDGFSSKEEAIIFAREKVDTDDCFFSYYATTNGPAWDSRELKPDEDEDEEDEDEEEDDDDVGLECRIEVMKKEQFVCFLHNLLVKNGQLNAPLYMPPFDSTNWFAMNGREVQLRPVEKKPSREEAEHMQRTKKQYMVLKLRYPATCMSNKMMWTRSIDVDMYGPMGLDNKRDHDGFITQEDAVEYAKEHVRDTCEWFTDYAYYCEDNAASYGPWDSAELDNSDNDEEIRVEVLTREEFACFFHNLMIVIGHEQGKLVPSPPLPLSLSKFMGW